MPFSFPNNPASGEYSKQNNRLYIWTGNVWNLASDFLSVTALVVGGGGAAGGCSPNLPGPQSGASGGGAGGFCEETLSIALGIPCLVSIGAGGACTSTPGARSTLGNSTTFDGITMPGGGSGGVNNGNGSAAPLTRPGYPGASGGGAGIGGGSIGVAVGPGNNGGSFYGANGGAGGGAGGIGGNASSTRGGLGGSGKISNITGTYYCGGGGGCSASSTLIASGGLGGGGSGGNNVTLATAGTANTGSGGGGGTQQTDSNGNGGSGVVVLRFSSSVTATIGAGLTYSSTTSEANTILTFTAGTDTITFN